MNNVGIGLAFLLIVGGLYLAMNTDTVTESDVNTDQMSDSEMNEQTMTTDSPVVVTPISHASMMLDWSGLTIYNDPVGDVTMYADLPTPELLLLTDVHGDHLNTETIAGVVSESTMIVAPQAVFDELTPELQAQTMVLANDDTMQMNNLTITGVPMYNLPEDDPDNRHVKGRGNGYVLDDGSYRVYIAGDTEDVAEMRALTDIDMAFVPMNPPYTMDVDAAAAGVLAFAPAEVYPYHFRTPDGFSDVFRFKELVETENSNIMVTVLDWYPDTEEDGV